MKLLFISLCVLTLTSTIHKPAKIAFNVQKRVAVAGSDEYKVVKESQQWEASQTAIIICDMWNEHWCKGATQRVGEIAPQMNKVLSAARDKGVLIVHAPSDCMEFYQEYPQRKAAQKYALATDEYMEAKALPTEKNARWPVDQSNEGCNDTPRCELRTPWKSQINTLQIKDNDVISDSGAELLRLFKDRKINNVILVGVHTNMCVMQRSFGMRGMIANGKNVVLMRDMTDLMYDARQYPYVNHFEGLGLMVEYIEKYVAPTVESTDITGEPAFRFAEDPRK